MHRALPLLACLAALPAAAQDVAALEAMTEQLSEPAGIEAQVGAFAACFLGNGDAGATAARFESEGWRVFGDAGMGMIEISHADAPIYVTLYMDGEICSVAHTTQPSPEAALVLENFLYAAGLAPTPTEIDGCAGWTLASGSSVGLTSGGQDPVCVGPESNDVRFYFPEGN